MRRRTPGAAAAALALGATLALAGCGLGPGRTPRGVGLEVTEGFGARVLHSTGAARVSGQDTVMRLLERNATVQTRYGGGFVQSIDGAAGGHAGGRPVDWFYYVNGVQAKVGAASSVVHAGDRVWWDRHDWGAAITVPAVVGAFPEPFLHGVGGRRLPVRLECDPVPARACDTVAARLIAAGVPSARGGMALAAGTHTLRVLVGPWSVLRHDPAAAALERGPSASGVYARPASSGASIALLDARAQAVVTLGAAGGLIAATRRSDGPPIWLVTGTDLAGVTAAAQHLDVGDLHDRFALAVAGGRTLGLPQGAP